jgi:5-methylcytosine-specific restriction endonuclease McrA
MGMTVCSVDGCGGTGKIIKGLCQRCYLKDYYRKHAEKLKQRTRDWVKANTERARANDKKKREAKPEKYASYSTAWLKRNPDYPKEHYYANREELLAKSKAWREANVDLRRERRQAEYYADVEKSRELARAARKKLKAKNPDAFKASAKRFKANNKDKVNADTHRRRARIKGGGGSYTRADWQAILERYQHTCPCCGKTGEKLTVDHVIPVAMGGSSNPDNLQPLCRFCNNSKNVRHTTRYEPWHLQSADAAE